MSLQIFLIFPRLRGCHVGSAIVVKFGDNVGLLLLLTATDDSKSVGHWKGPRERGCL